MDPRIIALINRILDNTQQLQGIEAAGTEYFFRFRNVDFSVTKASSDSLRAAFFVYPHWKGNVADLALASARGALSESDMAEYTSESPHEADLLGRLWETIRSRHMNIDEILKRLLEE